MQLTMLNSKIHWVVTTMSEIATEGSCAIDSDLLLAANIRVHEQIHIYNVTTGARFTTYAIQGQAGSGIISVNGAAAHLSKVNDILIIASYVQIDASKVDSHRPNLVYVDSANKITKISQEISIQNL